MTRDAESLCTAAFAPKAAEGLCGSRKKIQDEFIDKRKAMDQTYKDLFKSLCSSYKTNEVLQCYCVRNVFMCLFSFYL